MNPLHRERARTVALVVALGAGCTGAAPPRAQWKVYLTTDVPVPALGQQVVVDFLDRDGNPASKEVARLIDASNPDLWPLSFGILPTAEPPRLRVRLYRLDQTGTDGLPIGSAFIDATATLPPIQGNVVSTIVSLTGACFGVAPDVAGRRTCDPTSGRLGPEPVLPVAESPPRVLEVGSWPAARPVPCAGVIPAGMTCMPGGAFLLGSVHSFPLIGAPVPERLVQLSPFAIDDDEVSVRTVRGLVEFSGLLAPMAGDPKRSAAPPECTYVGATATDHDDYPVNCVSWATADRACKLLGKRLPTEAEWEYTAGNAGQRTPFPWGGETNICDRTIAARGRPLEDEATECRRDSTPPGPVAGGNPLDVTMQGVRNLAGNVDEWAADFFDDYTGPCWSAGGTLLLNPLCATPPENSAVHAIRGGSWQLPTLATAVSSRDASQSDGPAVATGFRCALSK